MLLDIPARSYDDKEPETVLQMPFSVPANVTRLEITGKRTTLMSAAALGLRFGTSVTESVLLGNAKALEVRVQAKDPKDGDFQFVFSVEPQYPASVK